MTRFRWTKQQDFCLRLGLLKALVATLPRQRRSQLREIVLRRLDDPLFKPAKRFPELLARAEDQYGSSLPAELSVSEALLFSSTCSSWGQPIQPAWRQEGHRETTPKILEWAQAVGLLGPGYRITERGIMLQTLFDAGTSSAFLGGNPSAWNPFSISAAERAFFFYHLGEHDELLWQLAIDLGNRGAGANIETSEAHKLTARGIRQVLERARGAIPIKEVSRSRVVRELVETIEWELDLRPRARRPRSQHFSIRRRRPGARRSDRRTTKNADHQAIPRFEQLVDLGFLTKNVTQGTVGDELESERKAWKFTVTTAAERFARAVGDDTTLANPEWHRRSFASALASAGVVRPNGARQATPKEAVDQFLDVYETIRRPAGNTPFESVAVLTMIRALEAGLVAEVDDLHRIFVSIKKERTLEGLISFAAGNEIEKMFLMVRPGFREAYARVAPLHPTTRSSDNAC
jgi:hypothetical protein